MIEHAIVVVNPACHGGRGWKRWLLIKDKVKQKLGVPVTELVSEKGSLLGETLLPLLQDARPSCIISAGGDGSLHTLVNALLKAKDEKSKAIPIGAVGLGSSNDFLKPFQHFIQGIPVRIDLSRPYQQQDTGRAVYGDADNGLQETYFIVNASFGATAEGNWRFNHPGPLLRWLKKHATGLAISHTALSTILRFTNKPVFIRFNEEERQVQLSNINLIKSPFISGTLHYTQPILPDDGQLGLNICTAMNRFELLQTLYGLEKGRFDESPARLSVFTKSFSLSSDEPVVFECDGETVMAKHVSITVMPKALTLLGQ
ncbi:MAG: hypothetical protein INR73_11120 [Williamsia sp.]|nr:hypothetical protein [Williamsia sp.]